MPLDVVLEDTDKKKDIKTENNNNNNNNNNNLPTDTLTHHNSNNNNNLNMSNNFMINSTESPDSNSCSPKVWQHLSQISLLKQVIVAFRCPSLPHRGQYFISTVWIKKNRLQKNFTNVNKHFVLYGLGSLFVLFYKKIFQWIKQDSDIIIADNKKGWTFHVSLQKNPNYSQRNNYEIT